MTRFDRILVVNLGGVGDLILSVPFLRGIRRSFPASRLELLASSRAAGVISGLPYFDRLRTIDPDAMSPIRGILRPIGAAQSVGLVVRLKARRFDLAVNVMPLLPGEGPNMRVLMSLIGPKTKAGRDTGGLGGFYDISLPDSGGPGEHETEAQARLLSAIGGEPDRTKRLEMAVPDTLDMSAASKLLSGLPPRSDGPIIGVCAGAGRKTRIWDGGRFSAVMDELHDKTNAAFVMVGDKADCGPAAGVLTQTSAPAIDTCGKTTPGRLIALTGRLNLLITNEAGPMFVAAALGVPTVAIIGPGSYARLARKTDSFRLVKRDADCSPCNRRECDDMKCLNSITAEDVVGAAMGLLSGGAVS